MKKTHKMRKIMLALFSAMLLVCVTVGATVAYLTSSDTVTNTFTVGNVVITLDETDVDNSTTNAERDKENSYKLLPGHAYTKDPIVHVASTSETCWLFVKVENEIANIEDATVNIADQMATKGWALVAGTNNIYAYRSAVDAGADVSVFDTFKIAGNVDNTTLASYTGKTIKVTAYAVQKDGFNTAAEAWAATFGAPAGNN